jgi:lipid A disaccharide synthetase
MIEKEIIGLPNLILHRMAVPELTQEHVNEQEIADAACELLAAPARREQMIADLAEAARLITGRGALARSATAVLRLAGAVP